MKIAVAVGCLAAIGGVAYVGLSFRKAAHTLEDAKTAVAREGRIPYKRIVLDRSLPIGFEPVSPPAGFRDAALLGDRIYVCAAGGVFAFDRSGSLVTRYRVGLELPPAPCVAVAAGAASGEPRLWIATSGQGLLEFDGHRFTQVRPADESARLLTAVLPIATGRILIGTEKSGVLIWDGSTLSLLHPALAALPVTALAGTDADLWIGTIDRGAFRWHAGQLDRFDEPEGLPDTRVTSLAVREDAAYVGTALGIAEIREGRFSRVLASGFFAKSLLLRGNTLLEGTLEEGVVEIPLEAQRARPRTGRDTENFGAIQRFVVADDRPYALTAGGLYERGAKGEYENALRMPDSLLADANISALAVDRIGRLWIGYFDRGLDILDAGFDRASHVEDEHVFCVNRIVHGENGGLSAVATANGLVMFDASGRPKQTLTKADGLISNSVTDVLLRGGAGNASIVAATPAGVTLIDASGASSLYAFQGLVNNHVYTLAAAGPRILVGTLGGLSVLDSGLVTASFTTANSGLKHNWVTAIAPVGNDWFIGTYGAGVMELDSAGRWTSFPGLKRPLDINPNAMAVTQRSVYAGTLGQGLAIYNRASGRWTTSAAGLPSLNITALAARNGYLYIGADNGLVRVPEQDLPNP